MHKNLKILNRAIKLAGGYEAFASKLPPSTRSGKPITRATVFRVIQRLSEDGKGVVPAEWCPTVSSLTGIHVRDLRRDVYPRELFP